MIGRLRQAGRRRGALVWTLALLFALAPALSMGFATPAAAFARTIVHAHDHGGEPHSHHNHDHHDHDDADHADLGTLGASPNDSGHGEHDSVHVHQDACCPSVIVPVPVSLVLDQHLSVAVDPPPTKALHGSSPSRLLRPPIV